MSQAPRAASEGAKERPGVTARAVVISLLLIPPTAYWVIQMELIRYQGHPTTISLYFNVIFTLLILLLVNAVLRWLMPRYALTQPEFLVIYSMLSIASSMAGHDMLQVLLPTLPHPYWFATAANKWEAEVWPLLPRWLMMGQQPAMYDFYNGSSSLYLRHNYLPWLRPLAWWSTFMFAMVWVDLCLNSILRRRWMETERLGYPIIYLPVLMTESRGGLFRNPRMWWGFAFAATVDLVDGLNEFYPKIPIIPARADHFDVSQYLQYPPFNTLLGMRAALYPFAIGLGFLLPTDLLFACWFFYLFWRAEIMASQYVGWREIPRFPFIEEQSLGAYLGLAALALWVSRGYLAQVWGMAWGRNKSFSDRGEAMPYRVALLGCAAGVLYMGWFYHRIGMALWVVPIYFAIHYLVVTAVTRVRAELGPPAHDLHHIGPEIALGRLVGPGLLSRRTLTSMALGYWFNRAYRCIPMPHQLEAMKIGWDLRLSLRRYAVALMLAAALGIPAAFWAMLHGYYVQGASRDPSAATTAFGGEAWWQLSAWLNNPEPPDRPALYAVIVGFLFTVLLMALRIKFAWWVFHPVGYAVSSSWSMNLLWLPLLVAWMAKVLITRYAGGDGYHRAVPVALGLILGEFTVGSFWCLYGMLKHVDVYPFWV